MSLYQQMKAEHKKKLDKLKRIQLRGLCLAVGAFVICFLGAGILLKSQRYDQEFVLTLSFLLLFPILALAGVDAKKAKAIDTEIVAELLEGIKLEKERRLGERQFIEIAAQHKRKITVIERAIPMWLILWLIVLRELYIFYILFATNQAGKKSYETLAFVTISCILMGVYIFFFFNTPYRRLKNIDESE